MAVIVVAPNSVGATCPMPRCGSLQASECPGGGYTWYAILHLHYHPLIVYIGVACNVWFDRATKERCDIDGSSRVVEELAGSSYDGSRSDCDCTIKGTGPMSTSGDDYIMAFKNVKWTSMKKEHSKRSVIWKMPSWLNRPSSLLRQAHRFHSMMYTTLSPRSSSHLRFAAQ